MPEIQQLEELRSKATKCIPNPSGILREIDKAEIVSIVKSNFERTGVKLPKPLKERLVNEYHYSEKTIERIVYECEFE